LRIFVRFSSLSLSLSFSFWALSHSFCRIWFLASISFGSGTDQTLGGFTWLSDRESEESAHNVDVFTRASTIIEAKPLLKKVRSLLTFSCLQRWAFGRFQTLDETSLADSHLSSF
jgi:hypothetical protein